jgi:hypothetical protein
MPRLLCTLAVTVILALIVTGCSDDDDSSPTAPPPVEPPPQTPTELVQRLRTVYAARDLDAYDDLLAADFLWLPQGGPDAYERDEELAVTGRMFTGAEGVGGMRISQIVIDQFQPQGVWVDTPAEDTHFGGHAGCQHRTHVVDIEFHIQGMNLLLRVQGPVLCYALPEGEGEQTRWRLLGIADATFGSLLAADASGVFAGHATENHSWTGVREAFR